MKTLLKKLWKPLFAGWMRFAHVLGVVNTTILLTLVYLILILPLRLVWFVLRKDPLHRSWFTAGAVWQRREPEPAEMEERAHPY